MSIIKEFREFAVRGNVVDMAVGIIIGAAFGKIVTSIVNDILMPPIGLVVGNLDFSSLTWVIREGSKATETTPAVAPVAINYGLFINNVIAFLITAFAVFILVKQINRLKRQFEGPVEPTTRDCPYCYSKIAVKATRCSACTSELKAA